MVTNLRKSKVEHTQQFSWASLASDIAIGAAAAAVGGQLGKLATKAVAAVAARAGPALAKATASAIKPALSRVSAEDAPVLFGQARIGPNFSTKMDVPAHLSGRSVADVSAELRAGTMSSDAIQITAFEHGGQLVTVNNRGLAALSEAGLAPTNLTIVSKEALSPGVLARLGEVPNALGTGLPSRSIAVTPSMSDWTVLRTISVPGIG